MSVAKLSFKLSGVSKEGVQLELAGHATPDQIGYYYRNLSNLLAGRPQEPVAHASNGPDGDSSPENG
jgi:hypothetical protein